MYYLEKTTTLDWSLLDNASIVADAHETAGHEYHYYSALRARAAEPYHLKTGGYGPELTTALVPTVPSPCFLRQSSTVAKVRETFCVSFVLIRFVIGELLSEVGGRVGHGLVLAWFESYVLRLVFLDSSLQSPRQEKHFGILFIPLRVVVREIHL